jgi:hypothetical protein
MILRSKATVGIGFEATLNVILLLFFSPDESEAFEINCYFSWV